MTRILILVAFAFSTSSLYSQKALPKKANYITVPDSADKVLKGYINRSVLQSDTSFKWFDENLKYASPNEAAVDAFKNNAANFSMVVFGGTWCHDTQNLLPVFYKLLDKSGYPEDK